VWFLVCVLGRDIHWTVFLKEGEHLCVNDMSKVHVFVTYVTLISCNLAGALITFVWYLVCVWG